MPELSISTANPVITPKSALERGLSIVAERDKKPVESWKRFQDRQPTSEEIQAWQVEKVDGYAFPTGHFNGFLVLDFDGPEGKALLERWKLNPHVSTPSGGYHCYFRHPGFRVPTQSWKGTPALGRLFRGLDIKGDGGKATFCNGDGSRKWLRPLEPDAWEAVPPEVRRFIIEQAEYRIENHTNPQYWEIRALQQVDDGEGRDNAAHDYGYKLASCAKLSLADAEARAEAFAERLPDTNTKGQPEPFTAEHVLKCVRSAYSHYESQKPESAVPDRLEDLIGEPIWRQDLQREWLIEPLIEKGSRTMFTAPPGHAKSIVALGLGLACLRGGDFVGYEAKKVPVLYVDKENHGALVKERMFRVFGFKEEPGDEKRFLYWGDWANKAPEGPGSPLIKEWVRRNPDCLVIFDSFIRFHPGNEQDATETARYFNDFAELRRLGATVIVIHHSGKAETAQDYRGSSDILANVETMFRVNSRIRKVPNADKPGTAKMLVDRVKFKVVKGRGSDTIDDLILDLEDGVGFVPSKASTLAGEDSLTERQERLLDLIAKNGGSTQNGLAKALKTARTTILPDLEELGRRELIWSKKDGDRPNSPKRYFRSSAVEKRELLDPCDVILEEEEWAVPEKAQVVEISADNPSEEPLSE